MPMHLAPVQEVWGWQPPAVTPLAPPTPHASSTPHTPQMAPSVLVGSHGAFGSGYDLNADELTLMHVLVTCVGLLLFIGLFIAVQVSRMAANTAATHQLMLQTFTMLLQQQQRRP